jgi:DNA-binding transcriptional LysR family regulator
MTRGRTADSPESAENHRKSLSPAGWADIELLRGIAATSSMRGAAKALRIKQSAAMRQFDRLTRRFGVPLATGEPDCLRLTAAGAGLLTNGRRFLRELSISVKRIIGEPETTETNRPALRLATVGGDWEEFIDDLATSLPVVLPTIFTANPKECHGLFDRFQVDAIYNWQPSTCETRLARPAVTCPVVTEQLWIGLPSWHPCANLPVVPLRELHADQWIAGHGVWRDMLVEACARVGYEPRIEQGTESDSMTRSLLWHGKGIALLSPLLVRPGADARFVVRPVQDGPRRDYVLTTDPAIVPDGLAAVLRQWLRASYHKRARRLNPDYAATLGDRVPEPAVNVAELASALSGMTSPARRPNRALDPEDVTILRVIGERGSLNRAAPALLISQPALTRRLVHLERRVGMKLLVRGHRGTALTTNARRLLDAVTAAERDFASAMRPLLEPAALVASLRAPCA